jgi:hypothetical protein
MTTASLAEEVALSKCTSFEKVSITYKQPDIKPKQRRSRINVAIDFSLLLLHLLEATPKFLLHQLFLSTKSKVHCSHGFGLPTSLIDCYLIDHSLMSFHQVRHAGASKEAKGSALNRETCDTFNGTLSTLHICLSWWLAGGMKYPWRNWIFQDHVPQERLPEIQVQHGRSFSVCISGRHSTRRFFIVQTVGRETEICTLLHGVNKQQDLNLRIFLSQQENRSAKWLI